jgi:hypothetical protein
VDVAEFAGWRVKDQDDEGVECSDNASRVERKFRNEKILGKGSANDCTDVCANAACLCDGIDDQFHPTGHILVVHLGQIETSDCCHPQTEILQNCQLVTIVHNVMRSASTQKHSSKGKGR